MRKGSALWLGLLLAGCLGACGGDDDDTGAGQNGGGAGGEEDFITGSGAGGDSGAGGQAADPCDEPVNDADCDPDRRPIVFVHGTVGSGENFSHPAMLFTSNGYCSDFIKAVDYNSVGGSPVAELDAVIAQLKADTGFDKVDLMGHSQGAIHGHSYASANPDDIAHYVHLAGQPVSDPPGVPTLCLTSTGDSVAGATTCNTTRDIKFQDLNIDHFAVAASTESFIEMFKFLNDDEEPKTTELKCEDKIVLEGRAVTFPDCEYVAGGTIEVYELGEEPRERGEPVATWEVPASGHVGPWEAKRGVLYEFKMLPPAGDGRAPRYSYLPPFVRSDRWLRFLYRTTQAAFARTTESVNYDDAHAVVIARHRKGAFIYGRDSMTVGGSFEALNEQNSAQLTTIVGLYMFDAPLGETDGPGNGRSDGGSIITGPFINSSDVFMQAATPEFFEVNFNGQILKVPNWPSGSQAMSLLFFY